MKSVAREVWGYAVLLIILFSIAAIAVWETISFFEPIMQANQDGVTFPIVMWSLTLGFMLIAGAYGIWAIKFSAEMESRRRIGRFVDAMDYFTDGLLAIDRNEQIAGSNPAAVAITGTTFEKGFTLSQSCPCLSDQDVKLLLGSREPAEVERIAFVSGTQRMLRFRSQPSEDLTLIAISDVTGVNAERAYNLQKARLQLVGHLARGMAHDFNRILCEMGAHASLLRKVQPGSMEMTHSLDELGKNVEKGIALAGHLLGLAQPDPAARFTDSLKFHLGRTADLLRGSLPTGWQIDISIPDEIPTIGLTGIQIEQVIFNLGILSTDTIRAPGTIRIAAMKPGSAYFAGYTKSFAAVIMVTTSNTDMAAIAAQPARDIAYGDSGVILSVVRSIIEEADGSMESLTAVDGAPVYRIALPHGKHPKKERDDSTELAAELKSYLSQWSILLAGSPRELGPLQQTLHGIGARTESVDNIISLLARIEEEKNLDAMVISKNVLGQETRGLLKAIMKLRPSSGIVVLCEDPSIESGGIANEVIFESVMSGPNKLLTALLEARSLTASRKLR